jgi:hypothetical protein
MKAPQKKFWKKSYIKYFIYLINQLLNITVMKKLIFILLASALSFTVAAQNFSDGSPGKPRRSSHSKPKKQKRKKKSKKKSETSFYNPSDKIYLVGANNTKNKIKKIL